MKLKLATRIDTQVEVDDRTCHNRRVDVQEPAVLKERMSRERARIADARDGADRVRARAQVLVFSEELERVLLLGERVRSGVRDAAQHLRVCTHVGRTLTVRV